MRLRWIMLALALAVAAPAVAQERIVVTASKVRDDLGSDYVIPHVGLTRRADFLLRRLDVSCDTREAEARADELRQTTASRSRALSRSRRATATTTPM